MFALLFPHIPGKFYPLSYLPFDGCLTKNILVTSYRILVAQKPARIIFMMKVTAQFPVASADIVFA
jgi:hypothetical protein